MDNSCHRRERTIYVSMLPENITDDDLYRLFQEAGPIEKVIFKQNADGTPQHALIVFRRVESVKYASLNLQNCLPNEQPLHIRPLKESSHHILPYDNFRKPVRDSFSTYTDSNPQDDDYRGYRLWPNVSHGDTKPNNHWHSSHLSNSSDAGNKHRPRPFNLSQAHPPSKEYWKNDMRKGYRHPPFSAGLIGLNSARSAFPLFCDDSLHGTTFNKKHMTFDKIPERLHEHARSDLSLGSQSLSFPEVERYFPFSNESKQREPNHGKMYTSWASYQGFGF